MKRKQGRIKKKKVNRKTNTKMFGILGIILGILLLCFGLWNTSFVKQRVEAALGGEDYQRKVYAQQKDLAKSKYGEQSSSSSDKKKLKKKKTHKKKHKKEEAPSYESYSIDMSSSSSSSVEAESSESIQNTQAQSRANNTTNNNSANSGSQANYNYSSYQPTYRQSTTESVRPAPAANPEPNDQQTIAKNNDAGINE